MPVAIPENQALELRTVLADSARHLHPSTAPDAIRDRQRQDVYEHRHWNPDATAAEIGEALALPTWSVECRIAELDGQPYPYQADPGRRVTMAFASVRREAAVV